MASALVAALDRPAAKRDIVFITKEADEETRLALAAATRGRSDMRILTVPPGHPRTKPRALMFALPMASGDFVVVYDAEDEPDPGQLKRAYHRFQRETPKLACLQASLNVYNARDTWLTRQFTLEYTALFDAILPTVQRLGLPVPLGGTSNHFRRHALDEVGGWDPYNVTEDADLGVRLARKGWRVEMLDSVTWEEAPRDVTPWLGQRARWLKGWMQTSLVHLRNPRYALWKAAAGDLSLWPPEGWNALVWWAGVANLAFAYAVGIALTMLASIRRHDARLAAHAILLPLYWMMISFAAYRALIDLVFRPFHWRKTTHTGRVQRNA
jgi:cellulose synthase/poly-beta-1,6-N-acetylglucosamine synthase-like glycosyltransferase